MKNLIDTVSIRHDLKIIKQRNKLLLLLKNNYAKTFKNIQCDGHTNYNCTVGNMKLFIDSEYVHITGSLHKFYMGNNVDEMPMKDINTALSLLNSSLGFIIDVKKGYVRRLDIGLNLIMNHKPTAYISKLYSSSSKPPTTYKDQTLCIGNKSRGLMVYDKTAEVEKANRKKLVKVEVADNLLRLEATVRGRKVFKKRFGTELPTVEQVLLQLNKLPDILYDEYKVMEKEYTVNIDRIENKSDLLNYAIVMAGIDKCKYVIDFSYNLNLITKQDRYRYHNTVKKAFSSPTNAQNQDLMRELDDKMLKWYNSANTSG